MAKVVGLNGYTSGKVGNTVYAVVNGIQTARGYQPYVTNPKSVGQNSQRAKANLAGRISSFVPRTAIVGLGTDNRKRRGEFLRNILKKATTTVNNGSYEAKIQAPDVIFSKGNVLPAVNLQSITATANSVAVALNGVATEVMSPEIYATNLVRIVIMVYEMNTTNLVEVSTKIATMPAQGASAITNIPIVQSGSYDVFVYAIPMSTENGSAVTVSTTIASLDDDAIVAYLSVGENSTVFKYGRSVYLGEGNFTQA